MALFILLSGRCAVDNVSDVTRSGAEAHPRPLAGAGRWQLLSAICDRTDQSRTSLSAKLFDGTATVGPGRVHQRIERGPGVLVTTANRAQTNVMALCRHTMTAGAVVIRASPPWPATIDADLRAAQVRVRAGTSLPRTEDTEAGRHRNRHIARES